MAAPETWTPVLCAPNQNIDVHPPCPLSQTPGAHHRPVLKTKVLTASDHFDCVRHAFEICVEQALFEAISALAGGNPPDYGHDEKYVRPQNVCLQAAYGRSFVPLSGSQTMESSPKGAFLTQKRYQAITPQIHQRNPESEGPPPALDEDWRYTQSEAIKVPWSKTLEERTRTTEKERPAYLYVTKVIAGSL